MVCVCLFCLLVCIMCLRGLRVMYDVLLYGLSFVFVVCVFVVCVFCLCVVVNLFVCCSYD